MIVWVQSLHMLTIFLYARVGSEVVRRMRHCCKAASGL